MALLASSERRRLARTARSPRTPAAAPQRVPQAPANEAVASTGFTRLVPSPPQRYRTWPHKLVRAICQRLDAGEDLVAVATSCRVLASEVYALDRSRRATAPAARAACATRSGAASARDSLLRSQCAEPQRLWALGLTIPEMSRRLGISASALRLLIVRARHHLGTMSFPFRTVLKHRPHPEEDVQLMQERLREQFSQAQGWWQAGVDRDSIALRLGLTRKRFDAMVRKVRRALGPQWFETRVLEAIPDRAHDAQSRRPRCAEDYALIIGLMCSPLAPAPGAAAPAGAATLAEHLRRLAERSQFQAVLGEIESAFATLITAPDARALPGR